jgi:hypothetical protein
MIMDLDLDLDLDLASMIKIETIAGVSATFASPLALMQDVVEQGYANAQEDAQRDDCDDRIE